MTARDKFETELAAVYNDKQLDAVLRGVLQKPLLLLVANASLSLMVTELMNELEMDPSALKIFLGHLIANGSSSEIKSAARKYLDDALGIISPQTNPYTDLMVGGFPFADRQALRDKLKDLHNAQNYRTLAAIGPRYCGRSHSRMLIKHVGDAVGIRDIYIDLLRTELSEIIFELVNRMQLDVKDTRDRMAQFTTQTKGFLSVLRGVADSQFVQNKKRWCIVFDHHDLTETPPERKEFAELMIQEVMSNNLPNIWIVVLGLGNCEFLPKNYLPSLMKVDLLQLSTTDIDSFISELYQQKYNQPMPPNDLQIERNKVLGNLPLPLGTLESMTEISDRLNEFCRTKILIQ